MALVAFVLLGQPAYAQIDTGLEQLKQIGLGTADLRVAIMQIVRVLLGFVGFLAILIVLYGGFVWMTSAGNPERIERAKAILRNAAIGLVIILMAFSIASFIIAVLTGSFGFGGGPAGPPGRPPFEDGQLGSGIIESVYPLPNDTDVPRGISILVTFKVSIDPSSVITDTNGNDTLGDCTASGCDKLKADSVYIYKSDNSKTRPRKDAALAADQVAVRVGNDNRTFTFDPVEFLGDGVHDIGYEVYLTKDILKDNGRPAFEGVRPYFWWWFEVGTFHDLDPVEVSSVFPVPDNQGDVYQPVVGTAATAVFTVTKSPQPKREASVGAVTAEGGAPAATVGGAYGCQIDALVCLTVNAGGTFTVTPKSAGGSCSGGTVVGGSGLFAQPTLAGGVLPIGCGLNLQFSADPQPGNQWHFPVSAATQSDTLQVADKTYTFVPSGTTPGSDEIELAATVSRTTVSIATKINDDIQNPDLNASARGIGGNIPITITSTILGEAGDFTVTATDLAGPWISLPILTPGTNSSLAAQVQGVEDVARNAVIKISFNEPVDISQVNPNTVKIEYDNAGSWTAVNGRFMYSNQFKTVEFLADSRCGVCSGGANDGQPCGDDTQCGGSSCNLVTNSCGDAIYCLPVLPNVAGQQYDATKYRVTIKAGVLQACTIGNCEDATYSFCTDTPSGSGLVCANEDPYVLNDSYFYPATQPPANGIIDASNNSFNGDQSTYTLSGTVIGNAEGPKMQSGQDPYNLNSKDAQAQGDDLIWSFFVNKQLDLSPPQVTSIGPAIKSTAVDLSIPLEAAFDELLMGGTLKPGSNYRDGQCWCNEAADCPDASSPSNPTQNYECIQHKCTSTAGVEQFYCSRDDQCKVGPTKVSNRATCFNRKYVSLLDYSTFPVGWWVTHRDLENPPFDTFADYTKVFLNHTPFGAATLYGSELGSGIKDVYQNCYLPSSSTDGAGGGCSGSPYCCNGAPLNRAGWVASVCFSGY